MPAIDGCRPLLALVEEQVDEQQHDDRGGEDDLGREGVVVECGLTPRRWPARGACTGQPPSARERDVPTASSVMPKMRLGKMPSTTMPIEQRRPREPLGQRDVVRGLVRERSGSRAPNDGALVQPQQVAGGEHGADRGDDHVGAEDALVQPRGRAVRREDRRELAPEPGEAGQTERGHRTEAQDPAEARGMRCSRPPSRRISSVW